MAEDILNEMLVLAKKQVHLQEQLNQRLLKSAKYMANSDQKTSNLYASIPDVLPQLPPQKQAELIQLLQIIGQYAEVGMVILFGSYSRGDWVEEYADDGVHIKYCSDFDLLVIVASECKSYAQKSLEQSIFKRINESTTIQTPVSILVHDIDFINCHLKKAQYFFSEICKDGIKLYDTQQFTLAKSVQLNPKERYQLAKEDFEYWYASAKEFVTDFKHAYARKSYNKAAFELHQVTERLYTCILLVFTRYKPNTHKLEILRKLVNGLDKRLLVVFPFATSEEVEHFKLLCEAYVDARYNKHYAIAETSLQWLAEKVELLMELTHCLCVAKIAYFLSEIPKKQPNND